MAKTTLERLRVATACPISWEQMTGDDRIRFCSHCHLSVYNISELGPKEAEELISRAEGRLCVRLYRRADGTVITQDCPVGLRALRGRVSKATAAVFAIVSTFCGVAVGQNPSGKQDSDACKPQAKITRKNTQVNFDVSQISGTVLDEIGAAIPGARVQLKNLKTGDLHQTKSNDEGKFDFTPLLAGAYFLTIEAQGFVGYKNPALITDAKQSVDLEVKLTVSGVLETVGILAADEPLLSTPTGTRIFTNEEILKLPIP